MKGGTAIFLAIAIPMASRFSGLYWDESTAFRRASAGRATVATFAQGPRSTPHVVRLRNTCLSRRDLYYFIATAVLQVLQKGVGVFYTRAIKALHLGKASSVFLGSVDTFLYL